MLRIIVYELFCNVFSHNIDERYIYTFICFTEYLLKSSKRQQTENYSMSIVGGGKGCEGLLSKIECFGPMLTMKNSRVCPSHVGANKTASVI